MSAGEITAFVILGVILLALLGIFIRPLKQILGLVLRSVLGGLCLYIFNLIFAGVGFTIGLNIVTASVCGILGLPGFVTLILGRFMCIL